MRSNITRPKEAFLIYFFTKKFNFEFVRPKYIYTRTYILKKKKKKDLASCNASCSIFFFFDKKTSTFIHHEIELQQRVQPAKNTTKYNRFGLGERSWKDKSLSIS